MVRRLLCHSKGAVREISQERPESRKMMRNGVSWWLRSMLEAMRFELQSEMSSSVPVLKKRLGRVQRGGQNRAGVQRKGASVTDCLYSSYKEGCSPVLFCSAQSWEINVMHLGINTLILVLSPQWTIEIEGMVWREIRAQLEHNKNAQENKLV